MLTEKQVALLMEAKQKAEYVKAHCNRRQISTEGEIALAEGLSLLVDAVQTFLDTPPVPVSGGSHSFAEGRAE